MSETTADRADPAYLREAVNDEVMPVAREEGVGNMGVTLAIDFHHQLSAWHRENGGLTYDEVDAAVETYRTAYEDRIPVHETEGVAVYGESRAHLLTRVADRALDGAYDPALNGDRPTL